MKEKMWSLLVHLNKNMWSSSVQETNAWDEGMWDYILEESVKVGINAIVLDVGNGIEYATHPEIAVKDAWTRKRVRNEVKRCREKGIKLIPKLNFATTHSYWQGEYRKMTSSTP